MITQQNRYTGTYAQGRARSRHFARRRIDRSDRNGDPLDGLVNLFDVAVVLAVAFLLAALTAVDLTELLSAEDLIVTKSHDGETQLIVKSGGQIRTLEIEPGAPVSGFGQLIGQLYQLQDGSTIYVPAGNNPEETP